VKTVYTLKRDIHLFGMSSIIFHVPDKVIEEGITLGFELQIWAFFEGCSNWSELKPTIAKYMF